MISCFLNLTLRLNKLAFISKSLILLNNDPKYIIIHYRYTIIPNFGTLESHQGVNSMNDKKEQIRHGNYANYNG